MSPERFAHKHALWLQILFTSFMIDDEKIKTELYDFSQTAFRHLRWIARELEEAETDYTYDRTLDLGRPASVFDALQTLGDAVENSMKLHPDSLLGNRMRNDEAFWLLRLKQWMQMPENDASLTAFDRHRTLKGKPMDRAQNDALTLFLFEESYKEYELILVYAYMQNRSRDLLQRDVYQDLIDESHFHLKSFGNLMAEMGILALPRPLDERTYKIGDVEAFIRNGIEEEENAKEQCRALSEAVKDETLSAFFDCINAQESYHIALMKKLL